MVTFYVCPVYKDTRNSYIEWSLSMCVQSTRTQANSYIEWSLSLCVQSTRTQETLVDWTHKAGDHSV